MDKAPSTNAAPTRGVDKLAALLAIMSAQIEAAMHETDAPAETLVETAHAMNSATETLAKSLMDFAASPARVFQDLMVLHDDMHARATKAATAIQFHDRLAQYLTHVSTSLTLLAQFVASGGAKSAEDWDKLRDRIRGLLSMEGERAFFDLLSGAPVPNSIKNGGQLEDETGKVELF
jgi:uncharacterized protein YigA (DUF484 family)